MPLSLVDSNSDPYKPRSRGYLGSSFMGNDYTATTSSSTLTATTTSLAPSTSRLNDPLYSGDTNTTGANQTDMLLSRLAAGTNLSALSTTSNRLLSNPTTSTTSPPTTTTTTAKTPSVGLSSLALINSSSQRNNNNNNNRQIGSSSSDLLQQLLDDLRQIEDTVDSIEIPARGRCKVYMAKFGYDPFEQSPNENPEAELALNAGDYIMVFDDIDEDGYFVGELIDGRRGYVPSNYLDRLTGDDLFDFQANVLYKQANASAATITNQNSASSSNQHQQQHHIPICGQQQTSSHRSQNPLTSLLSSGDHSFMDPNDASSYPPEFYEAIIGDTLNHSNFQHLHLDPEDYHRMNDYVDLEDVDEIDDECLSDYERAEAEQMRRAVAPPQRLVLERQLNKSILISWLHPQAAKGTIVSYQIYVDGVMKSTVPSGDRTKALLEGVDSNVPHRISVRAIDLHGRHSNDAACTIVTGRQVPFAPACVKASHITSDSALISWLPCNSNFHHVVAVNSVEVQTVRPGAYKHLINGLSANTLYRVWVRAKPGIIWSADEKNPKKLESLSTYVDFKTMPKSLPDPPVNVQVEAGPQRRTLLVTWLPLTLNDFGVSNGCPITGYAVFAGHKKLADVDSPTGDHALLDLSDLESLHKKSVTVRTKSGENLSQDSMPCHIPDEYLKFSNVSSSSTPKHHNQHEYLDQLSQHPLYAGAGRMGGPSQYQSMSSPMHNKNPNSLHQNSARLSSSDQQQISIKNSRAMQYQSPHRQKRGQLSSMSRQSSRLVGSGAGHHQAGRQMSRSLQNLESDLESRRSSYGGGPSFDIVSSRDQMAPASDNMMINNTCESYSEEEFENSMRCRGLKGGSRGFAGSRSAAAAQQRFRGSRGDSNSLNGQNNININNNNKSAGYQSGSLAKLRASSRPDGGASSAMLGPGGLPIRFFVALFDYDPSVMSPNPNAAAEELAFKEGSIIKIYGDKGVDGFYQGELDGQLGFVPCNVVTEVRDPKLIFSLQEKHRQKQLQQSVLQAGTDLKQQQLRPLNNQQQPMIDNQQQQLQQQQQQLADQQQQNGFKRMIALYDYDPQENSPNADTESEIPFKQGDVIYIYGKMDTDGFFMGEVERTKQRGLVPSNFLRDEMLNVKQQQQQQPQQSLMNKNQPQMMMSMQQQQQQQQRMQNPMQNNQQQFIGNNQPMRPFNQANPMNAFQQVPGQQARQMNPVANVQNAQSMQMSNQQMRPGQGQQITNQQAGNLVNRPSSLSLMNAPGQQAQMMQQQLPNNGQNVSTMMQPQQQLLMQQQQQANMPMNMGNMQQQQQQQHHQLGQMMANNNQSQQQGGGGVLSNLLSSGKQIIGAATTPRGPPNQNQMMNPNQAMMMQQQQQQQQQPGINNQPMQMGIGGFHQNNQQQDLNSIHQQQQQHQNQPHQFQMMNSDQNLIQSSMGNQQHQMMNNSNNILGGHQQGMPPVMQGGQPMQAGQMGRGLMGANYSANGAEEQGGNILNTVKNMFKL